MRYRDAGVDISAASRAKSQIKELVSQTFNARVLRGFGAFGGFFSLKGLPSDAVLVSSMDGVGTKLKIAFAANRHEGVAATSCSIRRTTSPCTARGRSFFWTISPREKSVPRL